jgi:hypothetical protein
VDQKIFFELARAWRAETEQRDRVRDGAEDRDVVIRNANLNGMSFAQMKCAEQLEQVLTIYSPLRD